MAGGFGAAALPLLASIALLTGAVFIILGFATPFWANDGVHYLGLWKYGKCSNPEHFDCYSYDQPSLGNVDTWLHVVRGLESLSIIFIAIPLVVLPVYMYIALGMYYKCMMGTMCVLSLLSSATGLVGVALYGANITTNKWDMAWSVIVVIVGCACTFIGFLILLIALLSKRPLSVREPFYPTDVFVDPNKDTLYTIRLEED